MRGELSAEDATEILLTKQCDLQEKMLKYERSLIKQALAQANGRVTHAASLLGLSHQGLPTLSRQDTKTYSKNALRSVAVGRERINKIDHRFGIGFLGSFSSLVAAL